MKKEPKEIIAAFKALLIKQGHEEGKVAALFNAEGTELIDTFDTDAAALDVTRISKVKTVAHQEGFDKGNSAGFKDGGTKWEKDLKEKYEIESDKHGPDLVDEIVAKKSTAAAPTLEEEKVKTHPAFINMQTELNKKIKDTDTTWKTKYEDRDKEIARTATLQNFVGFAKKTAEAEKFLLPKGDSQLKSQWELFGNKLTGYGIEENANVPEGFIITKDGKAHTDAHGNQIKPSDFVKQLGGELWEKEGAAARSTAGNNNDDANKDKKKVEAPKNKDEYSERIRTATTREERIAIDDAWNESQKQA